MTGLTISKAARDAGVGVETIRFYERKGLIAQPSKGPGPRSYSGDLVRRIRFVRETQHLGFSLRETKELLGLRADPGADCADVRKQAADKLAEVRQKIVSLHQIEAALEELIAACPGRGRIKACSILDTLEARSAGTAQRPACCSAKQPRQRRTR